MWVRERMFQAEEMVYAKACRIETRLIDCVVTGATHRRTWQAPTHVSTHRCAHTHAHTFLGVQMWGRNSILKEMRILIQGTSVSSHWSGLLWVGFHGNSLLSSPKTLQGQLPRLLQLHRQGSPSCQTPRPPPPPLWAPSPGELYPRECPVTHRAHPCLPQTCLFFPTLGPMLSPDNFGRWIWLLSLEGTEAQGKADIYPGLNSFHVGSGDGAVHKRSRC